MVVFIFQQFIQLLTSAGIFVRWLHIFTGLIVGICVCV